MEPDAVDAASPTSVPGSRGRVSTGRGCSTCGSRSDDELRALLKGSAMKRAGVKRLRRNLAVAIGNSGDPARCAALRDLDEPTCADPLVAEHVAWAVEKLGG